MAGGREQPAGERLERRVRHVLDVAAAGVQRVDAGRIGIEADDLMLRLGKGDSKR